MTFKTRAVLAALALSAISPVWASDHLDTRTVIEDPRADIGDLYAWTSYDGKKLNLVMTIVGHTFSDQLDYVFHIDSGAKLGQTSASTNVYCRFASGTQAYCQAGNADLAQGDASSKKGLWSQNHRFRVFAGLRDDPFFNNVKGARDAYQVAAGALRDGAKVDGAGCGQFDAATSHSILDKWRHTDGGPAKNFLNGWTPASLVISIDLDVVSAGGKLLGVWATTETKDKQMDRMGRPLTGNAMLAPLAPDDVSDHLKQLYNESTPADGAQFVQEIEKTLGLYDSFDAQCGNSLLADPSKQTATRYEAMANLLADDRLWVNTESTICQQFFAVELATLAGQGEQMIDCGGRTLTEDAVDIYRSILVTGTIKGVDDGVDRDEHVPSNNDFPFLAPPPKN